MNNEQTHPTEAILKSFLKYQLCLMRIAFGDFKWWVDFIIASVIAALSTAAQVYWQIVPANQRRAYWFSVLGPYALIFGLHLAWKRFVAPWKLDNNRQTKIGAQAEALELNEARVQELAKWPVDHPTIRFLEWAQNPQQNSYNQRGFLLKNDGGAALEVRVEEFAVGSQKWGGESLSGIGREETKFALVWWAAGNPFQKFDLLSSVQNQTASQTGFLLAPDMSVSVSVIYRDAHDNWYRSQADLTYIRSQYRLHFGSTRIEKLPNAPSQPLTFPLR